METNAPPQKKSHAAFLILLLLVGLGLAGAIAYELGQRKTQDKALAATVEGGAHAPTVNVAHTRLAPSQAIIELPCQTVAMVETPIYARADGYILHRPVDIGNRVKKGQMLFEIES